MLFICPPTKLRHRARFSPEKGISVIWPHLVLPRRAGGLELDCPGGRTRLRKIDALWVNDASLGVRCLEAGIPTVYDVTDDWRGAELPESDRVALVAAEDRLAKLVDTVVCSEVLRDRWRDRYGVFTFTRASKTGSTRKRMRMRSRSICPAARLMFSTSEPFTANGSTST